MPGNARRGTPIRCRPTRVGVTAEAVGGLGRMNAASAPRVGRKCGEFGVGAGNDTECRPTKRGIPGYADVGRTGFMPTARFCCVAGPLRLGEPGELGIFMS